MGRNYVALPYEYLEEMAILTDEEMGRLVRALLRYGATGEDCCPDGREAILWRRVTKQEDRFQESYETVLAERKAHARKAAQARWGSVPSDAGECPGIPGDAQNANTNTETETKTETKTKTEVYTERETKARGFVPPTPEEARELLLREGLAGDGGAFVDYYASRGWKLGSAPMENWQAALRSWARREGSFGPGYGKKGLAPPPEDYTAPTAPTAESIRTMEKLEALRRKMNAS